MSAVSSSPPRDRRNRHTFWIDDRVIDCFAPVMGRYPFGAAALAVYAVLARRADREGDSWPSLGLIAAESGTSLSTVKRVLRLLELLELVEISLCYEQGSQRQTSHIYTLLTPPDPLPDVDPDPRKWPPATRRTLFVRSGNRSESIAAARIEPRAFSDLSPRGERPGWTGLTPGEEQPPVQPDRLPPFRLTAAPVHRERVPPFSLTALEGNPEEGNTRKEGSLDEKDGKEDESHAILPSQILPSFVIPEIGLTNRQVWAATLGELARRGEVGRPELESWLRPAALIGHDGETPSSGGGGPGVVRLVIGAPNAVTRERIATRLLPAVREALGATIGAPVEVSVVVAERG